MIPWALKQMSGATLAAFIFSEVGPELAVEPLRQHVVGIELSMPNGFAALAVAIFFVVLSRVKIGVANAHSGLTLLVELLLAGLIATICARNLEPV